MNYSVILFYKFFLIKNTVKLMKDQRRLCESLNLKGRMLIAEEGVNATFEGKTEDIKQYKKELEKTRLFKNVIFKDSEGTGNAFSKLEIKIRKEIVTLGVGSFNIKKETAKEVTADELEKMYENQEDFTILDLRNDYEITAGYFDKTINPQLRNFRDLPKKISKLKKLKKKKVVAVCTGGIRCEKATCLLRKEGFENLYQLKDGIHTYMQKYPARHFKGSLYVFDNRMVTPVVDVPERKIVGRCVFCGSASEDFYSDDSVRPSAKIICCINCISGHSELRSCSG